LESLQTIGQKLLQLTIIYTCYLPVCTK